jgi:hypothetical protein
MSIDDDTPIREYVKRNCPYDAMTQPKEYHNWYYSNVYKSKQSEYYRKKREQDKIFKRSNDIDE